MPRLIRKVIEGTSEGTRGSRVDTGVDVIGDIAIIRLAEVSSRSKKEIAEGLLAEIQNLKSVFEQEGGIEGEFRLRRLRFLAGEDRTLTTHRENGCQYRVDVASCYFSPRLSTERLRVAAAVEPGERVLNMFAGVGPFSIPIAKRKKARVTSCELNGAACELHRENNKLNRVQELVEVVNADALELPDLLEVRFDRILMPHPSKADEFLGTALSLAEKGARLHYYRQVLGRDEKEAAESLRCELVDALPRGATYSARRVREVGPRWLEMVADITLDG